MRITKKIESYLVTHNGVELLIPRQGANTQDPEVRNPALKGVGSGHFLTAIIIRSPTLTPVYPVYMLLLSFESAV
jgi:hypothetical protein